MSLEAANAADFAASNAATTYLAARGYSPDGNRSGGIREPKPITLVPGTVLIRLYNPSHRVGQWWWTPWELQQILDHFGLGEGAFRIGAEEGKSLFHAVGAVRHGWGNKDPDHLALMTAIALTVPFGAYHGEGDVAPDRSSKRMLKPQQIRDAKGRDRYARQIYIPSIFRHPGSYRDLQVDVPVDAHLTRVVRQYNSGPLSFET